MSVGKYNNKCTNDDYYQGNNDTLSKQMNELANELVNKWMRKQYLNKGMTVWTIDRTKEKLDQYKKIKKINGKRINNECIHYIYDQIKQYANG